MSGHVTTPCTIDQKGGEHTKKSPSFLWYILLLLPQLLHTPNGKTLKHFGYIVDNPSDDPTEAYP